LRRRPLTARGRYLWRKYEITEAQYEGMSRLQRHRCKICRFKPTKYRLQVDHNHKTNVVRGLLCIRCNYRLLGRGLEQAWLHEAAARYLRSKFDGRNFYARVRRRK